MMLMFGRTVLITGAGSGIGYACALQCAARGAQVVAMDNNLAAVEELVARLNRGETARAWALTCDVGDERSVAAAFGALRKADVVPDGAVLAAGIDLGGPIDSLPAQRWEAVLATNLTGVFLVCRQVLQLMLTAGKPGSIVLCSSPAAFAGFAAGGAGAYAASKGGVSALVRVLAVDYAGRGIRVNAIVPGPTETPLMWANVAEAEREAMRATVCAEVPLGRIALPEEPAAAATWLLSDEASYVTGSHLVVDGGVLAKASISV
jgi:NAD(P)-dependent dehydrogenase (short-subunit alcohol dehydrogenase family)